MGSPSLYTPEIGEAICARLAEEPSLGLREILRQAGVPKSTFHDWRKQHPALEEAYQAAKEDGFDNLAHECLEIADDGRRDYCEIESERGSRVVVDTDHIQRAKLRVETRLKLLAKWDPKRYGERMTLANDPEHPFGKESDEVLQERFRRLAEKVKSGELDADSAGE